MNLTAPKIPDVIDNEFDLDIQILEETGVLDVVRQFYLCTAGDVNAPAPTCSVYATCSGTCNTCNATCGGTTGRPCAC